MGDTGFEIAACCSAASYSQDSELRQNSNCSTPTSAAFSGAELDETAILAALAERYGDDFARLAGVWKSIPPEARAEIVTIATNATSQDEFSQQGGRV